MKPPPMEAAVLPKFLGPGRWVQSKAFPPQPFMVSNLGNLPANDWSSPPLNHPPSLFHIWSPASLIDCITPQSPVFHPCLKKGLMPPASETRSFILMRTPR